MKAFLLLFALVLVFMPGVGSSPAHSAGSKHTVIPWSVIEAQGSWHLHVGQSGWTITSAMLVDRHRHAWLLNTYGLSSTDDLETDRELYVQRRADGYHVTASWLTSFHWVMQRQIPAGAIPVAYFTNHEGSQP